MAHGTPLGKSGDAEEGGELELPKFSAAIRPTDTVVDFGCGPGGLLARLNARIKIGVELNAAAKEAAERRGLTVVASTAELEDGCADVVISNHALEHTLRPYDELCELQRALRVGGRLLLWLPLDDWRAQRTQRVDDPDNHLYAWTPRLLANLLREVGFEVLDCRVVTAAWPPRWRMPLKRLRPGWLFAAACFGSAVGLRRRQLKAVAVKR